MTADESLLQDDVFARREALDVSRSFIVQAPAGSGKTDLLIQRYLKLLAVVEDPEEILAITFTRKASAEMQLRVLDALRRQQRGEPAEQDHERLTLELAARALQRNEERGWNLIANPRRMRIMTLDALNAFVSRSQPFSAPQGASGARIVVDAELKATHRDAAIATLDWLVEENGMQVAVRQVLEHVDNNTHLYVSYVSQMLATRDQWLPFVGSGLDEGGAADALRSRFEDSLHRAVSEYMQRTANAFSDVAYAKLGPLLDFAAGNLLASEVTSSPICELAGLQDYPAGNIDCIDQWLGVAELLLTQKGPFRKKVDKRQGFASDNKDKKKELESLLDDLSAQPELSVLLHGVRTLPPIRYSDEQWAVLLALFRLLPLAVAELRRLFDARGIADYIEVALNASEALGTAEDPGDVALLLDYQVRHMLVDEMQDTSNAQYQMLEALSGGWEPGDGRTLICVGDPMQSIYRFRNAEVGQFLLARQSGLGAVALNSLLLRRNFRSGENLVTWFNQVFPSILAADNDARRGAVAYSNALPVPQLAEQGSCHVHAVFGSDAADEASVGCEAIAATLAAHPQDDLAVLVRGRTQLPALLARLRAAGIEYRAVEIDRLTDLAEIIDVLALTRAAVHQGDRLAWLAILRAPWIGLSWSDLHGLVSNDVSSTVWELLQNDDRLESLSAKSREAVTQKLDILQSLVHSRRTQTLRDLVEKCWITMGGPATLNDEYAIENVYRYFDVLGRLERAGTLLDVAELENTLDLERVSNNNSARVQVMTMHRAKGLQFNHVFLYGLGRAPGSGDSRLLSWFDIPGEHGIEDKIISPIGRRADEDRDPVHRFIALTETEKNKHEIARLLYVACTRAIKSLHLIGNVNVVADGSSYKPPRSDSLLHLLWPSVKADYAESFDTNARSAAGDIPSIWATPVRRRFAGEWVKPPVDALPGLTSQAERDEPNEEVEFYWVGTAARITGTLVHRWLQLMAEGRVGDSADAREAIRPVVQRWLRELGVSEETGGPVIERFEDAIRGILDDARGQWILSGQGHAELGLSGVLDGEVANVVLDRVRVDDDGTHWIIDYKTSSHEGGGLAQFLEAETQRYRPQLARYAALYGAWAKTDVKCALYFPLLRSFVEVAV